MFLKLDKFYDCMVPIGSIGHMKHILELYENDMRDDIDSIFPITFGLS